MRGQLKQLGHAGSFGQYTKFDEVEIGDRTVRNLHVPPRLEHYLRQQLHTQVELGIWTFLWMRVLIVLATGDGKVRRWGFGMFLLVVHSVVAVVFTPLAMHLIGPHAWIAIAFMLLYDAQTLNGWRVVLTTRSLTSRASTARGA